MTDSRGFTVIELLLTVVILGILAGTALPAVSNIVGSQQVKAEARHLASAMRQAQQEALTREVNSGVIFNSSSAYLANGRIINLPEGITYTVLTPAGTTQVIFSALGVPSPSAGITIQFRDGAGHTQNVKINPSGRITIETP